MPNPIPHNALIVVADGGGGTLFRNVGAADGVSLQELRSLSPKDLASEGPSGSRPESQTPHQTDEATFAKQLAQMLFAMHGRREFEALVLILDPQTLGQVRECMHKTVEASIVRTLAKDLTNHAPADVEKALSD